MPLARMTLQARSRDSLASSIVERAAELAHLAPVPQALDGIAGAGPLGGAAMPAHRLREIAGLFPVMRQQRRLLVEVVRRAPPR